jgi:hypothetical protein
VIVGQLTRSRSSRSFRLEPNSGLLQATAVLVGQSRTPVRLQLVGPTAAGSRGRGRAQLRAAVERGSYRLVLRAQTAVSVRFRLTIEYQRR